MRWCSSSADVNGTGLSEVSVEAPLLPDRVRKTGCDTARLGGGSHGRDRGFEAETGHAGRRDEAGEGVAGCETNDRSERVAFGGKSSVQIQNIAPTNSNLTFTRGGDATRAPHF